MGKADSRHLRRARGLVATANLFGLLERKSVKLFEQQPGESDRAFAAFKLYRDMGAERTHKKVGAKLGKSTVQMEKWSRRWKWQIRIAAWNEHRAQIEREAMDQAARDDAMKWALREREHRVQRFERGQALMKKAADMLAFPLAKQISRDGKTIVEPAEWTMAQAARMMEVGEKLVAMAVGAPTERTAVEVSGPEGEPIQLESVAVALDEEHIDKILGEYYSRNGNHRSKVT